LASYDIPEGAIPGGSITTGGLTDGVIPEGGFTDDGLDGVLPGVMMKTEFFGPVRPEGDSPRAKMGVAVRATTSIAQGKCEDAFIVRQMIMPR
jgi:hypothetical protein